MKLKLLLCSVIFLAVGGSLSAQQVHPNISYNALLNAACTNANTACSQAAFVTGSIGYGTNTFPPGTYSTLDIPTLNYNAATITVQGTYSGVTIAFDFSDPTGGGGNTYYQQVCARTDVNVLEPSEVLPTNQTRAWNCPAWATTRLRLRLSAYSSGTVNVWITLTEAAIDPSLVVAASPPVVPGSTDPCQDLSQQKQSVVVNVASATTTQLVAISGTTQVYVCGYQLAAVAGTNPSAQFEYGTGASCGTGTTTLTGAMATGVTVSTTVPGPVFTAGNDVTLFKAIAGNALCLVTGGTTPNFQGFVTFVQQ